MRHDNFAENTQDLQCQIKSYAYASNYTYILYIILLLK